MVSDKEQSSYIKPYVDSIHQQIMFAEKSWGSFRVLDVEDASMTIKITLTPGHGMNYHSHENRDEVWTVISGTGHAIVVDGVRRDVKAGDILTMPAGCHHTVFADSELKIIEFSSVRPSAWRISRSIRCRRLDSRRKPRYTK